ncbi:hypothetical protein [Salinisphaera hydrothermalis]|uniref:hypothetical protein n=1 Tax=Salinisphaera hydrothermalis TaxID=563188 RepID=UPI0033414CCF
MAIRQKFAASKNAYGDPCKKPGDERRLRIPPRLRLRPGSLSCFFLPMPDRDFSDPFHYQWSFGDDGLSLHHASGVVIRLRSRHDGRAELPIASIDLPSDFELGPDRLLQYINSAHRFWRTRRGD